MGISLKGHAPDFQYWVFDIDGKTWVAVNQSTPEPLNINFVGNYREWPSNLPLINTSGFNILGSSTASTNDIGEKQGKVEWVWSGKRYLSTWVLSAGREISPADPEEGVPATFEYGLNFVGRVPYDGPTGGTIGSGGVAPAPVQAQTNAEAVSDTSEALVNANKALAASEAQGKINVQALNTARAELENAKAALAAAEARATQDQAAMMERLREQVAAIEERTQIQINVYRQALDQAKSNAASLSETNEALANANRALAVSEAQGKVNAQALNTARVELESAKAALSAAESRATQEQAAMMERLREQVAAIEERTQIQINVYRQAMEQAKSNAASLSETNEALVNANRALAASESQGKVNAQALNTARVELENAKSALAAAEARATQDQAVLMERLREQVAAIEERTQIQINVYRQALEEAKRTPPATTPPATTPPTAPPTAPPVSPAGTDWVKLGLQLGAAYLLLS